MYLTYLKKKKGSLEAKSCFEELPKASFQIPYPHKLLLSSFL